MDNEGFPIKFDMWNSGEPNDLNGEDAAHIIHANSGWINNVAMLYEGLWNDQDVSDNFYVPCVFFLERKGK